MDWGGAKIRILFATGQFALPQVRGGSQRTSDAIIRGLIARGHDVRLLAALRPDDLRGKLARFQMKLLRRRIAVDTRLGYKAYRAWDAVAAVEDLVRIWRPDVAVALTQRTVAMGKALQNCNMPLLVALQDNEFPLLEGNPNELKPFQSVANSIFTARKYEEQFGFPSKVIHPVIERNCYHVHKTGSAVTFVNPDPKKGYGLFIEMAAMRPEYEFILVPGWPLPEAQMRQVADEVAQLPNVFHSRSEADMRVVYARTKVLLVPSQWEEGYGRVATEAQFSGIPVLGSDMGGLPEAIGSGGTIIPAGAPIDVWLAALDRFMLNPSHLAEKSSDALMHASRQEMRSETQIDEWEQILANTVMGCGDSAAVTVPTWAAGTAVGRLTH